MRLWFAASSEVPIYKQLATQVTLAILSGELKPGDRLPSTRELARRFALHANTISAGYRLLEREGWAEHRHGSGVFVCERPESLSTAEQVLDLRIAAFFRAVRDLQLPADLVRKRVEQWLAAPPPDHFLVVDPDAEVRRILVTEVARLTPWNATGCSPDDAGLAETLAGAVPVCRPSQVQRVRAALPLGVELVTLPIRSAQTWLAPWLPAPKGYLVAVASRWPEFLAIARTMLVAAGLQPEALLLCDAREPRWKRGAEQAEVLLCDAYTASLPALPAPPRGPRLVEFSLLAETAAAELQRFLAGSAPL